MGIDLGLFPVNKNNSSYSKLECERHRELFDKIFKLNSEVIDKAEGYFYDKYKVVTEDHYGNKLRRYKVSELLKLTNFVNSSYYGDNKPIWAYLNCLPEDNYIVLYWH